jgi:hypothetical protein
VGAREREVAETGRRNTMKFENLIRTHVAIAGCAAVLSFAGATRAQEIENTTFDDGPNVAPFTQPATIQEAVNIPVVTVLPGSQATLAMASIGASPNAATKVYALWANDEREPSAGLIWTGIFRISVVTVGRYANGPARRLALELRSLRDSCTFPRGV